jgi:hypothetical protein
MLGTKVREDRELQVIRGILKEKERFKSDGAEIELHLETLKKNITGFPAAFAFNLDDSGF